MWGEKTPRGENRRLLDPGRRGRGAFPAWAAYGSGVKTFLTVLIVLLMFATLAVLIAGMVGLVRGGGDPRRSNKLMRWRVILQGAALLLFAILMSLLKS